MTLGKIDKRLQSSGLNQGFPYDGLPFSDYIKEIKNIINHARVDINQYNQEKILAANAPREFNPKKRKKKQGFLFIHGLLESPYAMQSLFNHFASQGYFTRSLLLPGHGTVPGDLLEINVDDWLASVRYAIHESKKEVDKLFVVGYSTGAALTVYDTYLHQQADGLVLFAPAMGIQNPFIIASNWYKAINWMHPRSEWFFIGRDKDYAKYQSIPFNAIHQVRALTQRLKKLEYTEKLTVPLMMILSDNDEVIDNDSALNFFQQQEMTKNRLLYYGNKKSSHIDGRIIPLPSAYPEKRILNFSHTGLAVAPDHPHYGDHGDFHDFRHYLHWWGNFHPKNKDHIYLGAITRKNLYDHYLARLHYNPDFTRMMTFIEAFLKTV